ncbi:MAG: hypothetical protein L3J79_10905 [Candidatus Marinimicrobia bacterium]|nr:hypothetical protein [Candidatus Neomarinimicrobiota bacterium]
MADIFDDGLSAEELAMALAYGETIAEEEREKLSLLQDAEPLVPDEDAPQWWEKD